MAETLFRSDVPIITIPLGDESVRVIWKNGLEPTQRLLLDVNHARQLARGLQVAVGPPWLSYACDYCGATPGTNCFSRVWDGQQTSPHPSRQAKATDA